MPKAGRDSLLDPCALHKAGSTSFDDQCEKCLLKCRGAKGCQLWLPLTAFKKQSRKPAEGKQEVLAASIWKSNCKGCSSKARDPGSPTPDGQLSTADRVRAFKLLGSVLQGGVHFFVEKQTSPVIEEYEQNEWVRLLNVRRAEVQHESPKETLMSPSWAMPASVQAVPLERARWLLTQCEWKDPALQAQIMQLEHFLVGKKAARDNAITIPAIADQQLASALQHLDDGTFSSILHAVQTRSFCALPSEIVSLQGTHGWLDHRIALSFDPSLPQLTAFDAPSIQRWICSLSADHIRAEWSQDGEPSFQSRMAICAHNALPSHLLEVIE